MNLPAKNAFEFADPRLYQCNVWSYRAGHSLMLVRVTKSWSGPEDFFYLTFESVQYFEGPLQWLGADFYIGTKAECTELLQRIDPEIPDDLVGEMVNDFRLFVVELTNLKVRILAGNAMKTRDIPPNFHCLVKASEQEC